MTPRNLHIGVYANASSQLFRRRQNVVFGSVTNELVNVLWLRIFHVDFQTVFMSIQLRISPKSTIYSGVWIPRTFRAEQVVRGIPTLPGEFNVVQEIPVRAIPTPLDYILR